MQVTRFRCFEPDGSQRVGHFNAFHFKEATGAMPCVRPGEWDHPYPIERHYALEVINRWNSQSQFRGERRCYVLAEH